MTGNMSPGAPYAVGEGAGRFDGSLSAQLTADAKRSRQRSPSVEEVFGAPDAGSVAGASSPDRSAGTARSRPGRRFCWPSSLPISICGADLAVQRHRRAPARCSCRASASACALVTTPICARPICTQSPWPTASFESISRPTSLWRGCSLRWISACAADEIVALGFQRHGEADARLERIGLIGMNS